MSLKITNVVNDSEPKNEYVRLEVLEECNLKYYAIVDNSFKYGALSNIHRHFYRFPSQKVEKGDIVRLYTGEGTKSHQTLTKGNVLYKFYINSKSCIWNDTGDVAYLYYIEYRDKKAVD